MKKENYTVTGMSCAACALAVEKAVNKKEGIDATVNLATEKMSVSFDESKYDFDKIREIVEKSGYGLLEKVSEDEKIQMYQDKIKEMKNKLILAVIFSIPLLYISMGHHMLGAPVPSFLNHKAHPVNFALAQLVFVIPIIYAGRDFFIHGIKNIFRKAPNMERH